MFSFVIFILSIIDTPGLLDLLFWQQHFNGAEKKKKYHYNLALEAKISVFSCWSLAGWAAGA